MNKKIPAFSAVVIVAIMMVAALAFAVPQGAMAYAIGAPSAFGGFSSAPGGGTGNYNFGSSLKNLLAPFTGFLNSLQGATTINTNGAPGSMPPPNMNVIGGSSQVQTTITGWLTEFDDWIYTKTGIRLSGIVYVFLSILQWVLNLVLGIVGWLLGFFRGT